MTLATLPAVSEFAAASGPKLPTMREVSTGLTRLSRAQLALSLGLPFGWSGLYFLFAWWDCWPWAILSLVALSFVTYGSISHDLVHGSLGLHGALTIFS